MNTAPGLWRSLPVARAPQRCIHTRLRNGNPGGAPDHGEKIWVFNHLITGQVIYSLKAVIDHNKAMRQLPFNGKKTRPVKLRKDYWKPMAVICLRPNFNRGVIGRSIFHKLREYRMMHELCWGDELLKSKKERGTLLNDQRKNTIADMAAVLSGRGGGNLVAEASRVPTSNRLYKVTVFWENKIDRKYAREWTGNVTHETMKVVPKKMYWLNPEAEEEKKAPKKEEKAPTEEDASTEEEKAAPTGEEKEPAGEVAAESAPVEAKEITSETEAPKAATEAEGVKAQLSPEEAAAAQKKAEEDAKAKGIAARLASLADAFKKEEELLAAQLAWEQDPNRDLWSPDEEKAKEEVKQDAKAEGKEGAAEVGEGAKEGVKEEKDVIDVEGKEVKKEEANGEGDKKDKTVA